MANEEHLKILKEGVDVWDQWRKQNPEISPDLSASNLAEKNLHGIDLSWASLYGAYLRGSNLSGCDLHGAYLRGANLSWVNLNGANLGSATFNEVRVYYTSFANVDLSEVQGLETVLHYGPSTIGIDTIYRSQGKIPEVFLRSAGVPEKLIQYMRSLINQAIQYYSCFISYSSKDQKFAERIYTDLQANGVRCWFAKEDVMSVKSSINKSRRRSGYQISS